MNFWKVSREREVNPVVCPSSSLCYRFSFIRIALICRWGSQTYTTRTPIIRRTYRTSEEGIMDKAGKQQTAAVWLNVAWLNVAWLNVRRPTRTALLGSSWYSTVEVKLKVLPSQRRDTRGMLCSCPYFRWSVATLEADVINLFLSQIQKESSIHFYGYLETSGWVQNLKPPSREISSLAASLLKRLL